MSPARLSHAPRDGLQSGLTPSWWPSSPASSLPDVVYRAPVLIVLLLSAGLLLVRDEREQWRLALLVAVAASFSYFLAYHTVWEYQYTSLLPSVAVLFLLYRRGQLDRVAAVVLVACAFYYLPSPYVLVRGDAMTVASLNWIGSTKVVASALCFAGLAGVVAHRIWINLPAPTGLRPARAGGETRAPRAG
jgi:hypothetical protein